MPVSFLSPAQRDSYGQYLGDPSTQELARYFHLAHAAGGGSANAPGAGCSLRAVLIGTLAPALDGWWVDLIGRGSRRSTRVHVLRGDIKRWDKWPTIAGCNPLMRLYPESRETLLEERDDAQGDPRLRAAFQSYRLNVPSLDETSVLLTTGDWELATARQVAPRQARPIVGLDLGRDRSWSAAVGWWPATGRVEAAAVAPGLPGLPAQEKRDKVPAGTYLRLVDAGLLTLADGLRVVPPGMLLVDRVREWAPGAIVCDFFRINELRDTHPPCSIQPRRTRWSEAAFDIRSLRRSARDGPMCVAPESKGLIEASLRVARVKHEDENIRLQKDGTHNRSRDDVAAALTLAAGAAARLPQRPRRAYHGLA